MLAGSSSVLAVALEGQLDKVYQIQLPATSVFGAVEDGKMPMQAYARFLNENRYSTDCSRYRDVF